MGIASIHELLETGPVIIGIIGGSGAGKSWLAARLAELLGPDRAGVVCQDSFYRDLSHLTPEQRAAVNFDHPNALDWAAFRKCLAHLASARTARVPQYNFSTHSRDAGVLELAARPVMIFDGLWLLHRASLRRFFQWTVFIDAPSALCLERRVARDVAERGRCLEEVNAWYGERVFPMQERFVEPQRQFANLILPAPVTEQQVAELANRISSLCGS